MNMKFLTNCGTSINQIVIPAKAGTQLSSTAVAGIWVPAFAGMTDE
jgi:hypothetical protein